LHQSIAAETAILTAVGVLHSAFCTLNHISYPE
jgi:hypothetical protein